MCVRVLYAYTYIHTLHIYEGSEGMAESVKYMLWKHEDLSSDPRVAYACNTSTAKTGKADPGECFMDHSVSPTH